MWHRLWKKDCLISSGYLHPFIQNNQNKLYTSGNNNLKDLIYTVFGREITANLLEVSASCPGVTITGYIGKPVIARSNRNYEKNFCQWPVCAQQYPFKSH